MKKYLRQPYSLLILLMLLAGCKAKQSEVTPADIGKVIDEMTWVMVHDVTNPPLAARFFAYSCLAGYEIVTENQPKSAGFQRGFNQYPRFPKCSVKNYNYKLSAVLAMMETAAKLQPSGNQIVAYEQRFLDSCVKAGIDQTTIDSSKKYAQAVSKIILSYAREDRYRKVSNYKKYIPVKKPGSWYPTPPAYIQAVEPYFYTVRPFIMQSGGQFQPIAPVPFSDKPGSAFFKQMMINCNLSVGKLSAEQREIAAFWDCNPFAVQDNGHMLIGLKKISPGAHWLGIANIACRDTHAGFDKTMEINTIVAASLMDSFISCWYEKYQTNRIRPETAINELADKSWRPLLQTPPFPEYVSGHSCVSGTVSIILSHYFGDHFSYIDTVENRYGIKPRNFQSFQQAADEAAISRLYGGIHFKDAVDNGLVQGKLIGKYILEKITR